MTARCSSPDGQQVPVVEVAAGRRGRVGGHVRHADVDALDVGGLGCDRQLQVLDHDPLRRLGLLELVQLAAQLLRSRRRV